MTSTVLKPKGNEVWDVLKLLKDGFDDKGLDVYEPALLRGVFFSDDKAFACWSGEILHQLALRAERRGELDKANKLYGWSTKRFMDVEYLGLARKTRDNGMMYCHHDDPVKGLSLIQEALELHQDDRSNIKGERQRRITVCYELRAKVLAGIDVDHSLDRLIEFAFDGCRDFCARDQHFVVEFTRPFTSGGTRRSIDLRRLELATQRRSVVGTAKSIANVVIDTELIMAGKFVKLLIGKV